MITSYSYLVSWLSLLLKDSTFEQYLQFFVVRSEIRTLIHFIKTYRNFLDLKASNVKVLDIKTIYLLSCILLAEEDLILLVETGYNLHLTKEFRL